MLFQFNGRCSLSACHEPAPPFFTNSWGKTREIELHAYGRSCFLFHPGGPASENGFGGCAKPNYAFGGSDAWRRKPMPCIQCAPGRLTNVWPFRATLSCRKNLSRPAECPPIRSFCEPRT